MGSICLIKIDFLASIPYTDSRRTEFLSQTQAPIHEPLQLNVTRFNLKLEEGLTVKYKSGRCHIFLFAK